MLLPVLGVTPCDLSNNLNISAPTIVEKEKHGTFEYTRHTNVDRFRVMKEKRLVCPVFLHSIHNVSLPHILCAQYENKRYLVLVTGVSLLTGRDSATAQFKWKTQATVHPCLLVHSLWR